MTSHVRCLITGATIVIAGIASALPVAVVVVIATATTVRAADTVAFDIRATSAVIVAVVIISVVDSRHYDSDNDDDDDDSDDNSGDAQTSGHLAVRTGLLCVAVVSGR